MSTTNPPSSRALNVILPLIASSQPYEAHQKARTFASRYAKASQFDTAIDVLFQSARELLKAGNAGSATDLAVFMLEVYETKGEEVTEESRGRLTQLISLTGAEGAWRKTIIDKSVSWSSKHSPCPAGDPDLHHYIGELLHKEGSFNLAEPHFLASGKRDSARLLASMMLEWKNAGSTPGAFVLRGTLPYLQNGNILAARVFVNTFTAGLANLRSTIQPDPIPVASSGEVILTTDPVVNFCQLAVLTCQRAHGDKNKAVRESWVRLCGTYQSKGGLLASEPVRLVLNEIGALYFSIPLPRGQPANPFGDMLSSLFGGGASTTPTKRVLAPSGDSTPSSGMLD